jgi:hypothetical protein
MPWMALAQTANSQKYAFYATMSRNRLNCILGAGWIKTTILPQKRADAQLIHAQ